MQVYTGVVEDINDPLMMGRVRVRVFGLHTDDTNLIKTEDLPWAQVGKPTDSASISGIGTAPHGLLQGSWVKVVFEDQDQQYPFVLCSILGISTPPKSDSSYEEISFGTITNENIPNEVQPVEKTECEANINISGYRGKFDNSTVTACLNACCDNGITNPYAKNAILANIAKECGFVAKDESFKYSVSSLRKTFPSKTNGKSDQELETILSSQEDTANFLYGGRYGNAANEGYKYRGRGYIQITFKSNYEIASRDTGVDLISNPEKLNQPAIASKAAIKFIIRNSGGVGVLNGFTNQQQANRTVTQTIGGKGLNLNSGIGAQFLTKVESYAQLGTVTQAPENADEEKALPIGAKNPDGTISDGLTRYQREELARSKSGFADPSGKYPIQKFLNEPDTNRLTRRNTTDTVFTIKKNKRRTGIQNVGGEFSQPSPPYNAQYPYCRGNYTESGHAFEMDDTANQERVSLFHRTGSFLEYDNFGNRVNKIVGSDYTIIEKNGYLYIDGTLKITCASTANITINGNVNMQIDGNYNLDVGGDINMMAGGSLNIGVGKDIMGNAAGNLAFDSTRADINSGIAPPLNHSSRDAKEYTHPEQLGESVEASEIITNDDIPQADAEILVEQMISEGKITKDEVEQGRSSTSSESEQTQPETNIKPEESICEYFKTMSNIPTNTMLSQSFSLADLTTKVALPSERRSVAPNAGLTEAEIVCNLKKLAENCLDKIKAQFPDMIITNTIRRKGNKSQHELGQAADLQFTTSANSNYYEIAKWIKDNVLFDQLLLEYKSTGTKRPWIHISYRENPRRQVLTLMNNLTHGQGLHQLA